MIGGRIGAAAIPRSLCGRRRLQRLVVCAALLLAGLPFASAFIATARAADLPSPPTQNAESSPDSVVANTTSVDSPERTATDSPESTTTTDVQADVETPGTTADVSDAATDTSAIASDPGDASSSSTDTSATTTETASTAGSTSESTDTATDTADSSCTTEGTAVTTNTTGTSGSTTDATDATTGATDTSATAASTTDTTDTCSAEPAETSAGTEAQTSASTDDGTSAVTPTETAPPGAANGSTSPEPTPSGQTDGGRALQSNADPLPSSPSVSTTGDSHSTTPVGGDITSSGVGAPADDEVTVIPIGQSVDPASWSGTLDAHQWQFEGRSLAVCAFGLPAGGCSVSQVLGTQWPAGAEAAHVRARGPGEDRGSGRPAQQPKSPRPPAPSPQLPLPITPGTSAGSGISEGFHSGAVPVLISTVLSLLALAGSRAVTLPERRPSPSPFVSLLERPG
jgi:hypothetical protein